MPHPEREEGPLATRLPTMICMVYRPWAGTRLRGILLWQEPCIHAEAYGFGPFLSPLAATARPANPEPGPAATKGPTDPTHLAPWRRGTWPADASAEAALRAWRQAWDFVQVADVFGHEGL